MNTKRVTSVWKDTESLPLATVPRRSDMIQRRPLKDIDVNIPNSSENAPSTSAVRFEEMDAQQEFLLEEDDDHPMTVNDCGVLNREHDYVAAPILIASPNMNLSGKNFQKR